MKRFSLIFVMVLMALSLSSCNEHYEHTISSKTGKPQQQYVAGTEDLPVYPGFISNEGENISYDSPEGRIVDASFRSDNVRAAEVRTYYETTLKQLGWNKKDKQLYERDGETLQLQIFEKAHSTFLKFNIRPGKS
jgi:hypothetical protein